VKQTKIFAPPRKAVYPVALLLLFISVFAFSSAGAVGVGWQKVIDDGLWIDDRSPANWANCDRFCSGCVATVPGKCAQVCTKEFFCAGPWRSYPWPDGQIQGGAYLYLSSYGASQPSHPRQVRKGWAAWQWQVHTSGRYRVEVMYRPTHNRSPDADYYVFALKSLGVLAGGKTQLRKSINQTFSGPLKRSGWLRLGDFNYYRGQVAAVGLWANDDLFSDEADAVRWTLLKKIAPKRSVSPANSLLLTK